MALLSRPVTMMIDSIPEATASSTTYWINGLSTSGNISFGDALVAGRKRVPRPAAVKTALAKRGAPPVALEDFAQADAQRRRVIAESDELNAKRNTASREIGALMKDGKAEAANARRAEVGELKARIAELDQLREQSEMRMRELLSTLPNIPHTSVPVGIEESDNVEIRRWGTKPEFDFEPRDHVDLGTALDILDLERAAKIAAARFAILNGAGA